jgi:hypothetical protein
VRASTYRKGYRAAFFRNFDSFHGPCRYLIAVDFYDEPVTTANEIFLFFGNYYYRNNECAQTTTSPTRPTVVVARRPADRLKQNVAATVHRDILNRVELFTFFFAQR